MSAQAASSSQFRVEKERVQATLTLANGAEVPGAFFVAEFSATHAGQERIHDVLNAESGFFPFEVAGPDGARTVMYNRDHVVLVALGNVDEARRDAAYKTSRLLAPYPCCCRMDCVCEDRFASTGRKAAID